MKINKQLCNPSQGAELRKLGVNPNIANWCWYLGDTGTNVDRVMEVSHNQKWDYLIEPAFTAQELIIMLGFCPVFEISLNPENFTVMVASMVISGLKDKWLWTEKINDRFLSQPFKLI